MLGAGARRRKSVHGRVLTHPWRPACWHVAKASWKSTPPSSAPLPSIAWEGSPRRSRSKRAAAPNSYSAAQPPSTVPPRHADKTGPKAHRQRPADVAWRVRVRGRGPPSRRRCQSPLPSRQAGAEPPPPASAGRLSAPRQHQVVATARRCRRMFLAQLAAHAAAVPLSTRSRAWRRGPPRRPSIRRVTASSPCLGNRPPPAPGSPPGRQAHRSSARAAGATLDD
mmetsp:Transcript_5442/g.13789  ORF Transcript_5442/g.13789 Transcript_5442/m.13789 type:complete len:224 (+) Transcript_5442:2404-3075(+)